MKDCPPPDCGDGYGIKSTKGEDVAQNFKAGQVVGIAEYINSRGEAIYKSTIEEPLGKAYSRGHVLPDRVKQPGFLGFGRETNPVPPTAKEVMFPRGVPEDSQEVMDLYKKTHGDFDSGEKLSRHYRWPEAVTSNPHHRFGYSVDAKGKSMFGVKDALSVDYKDESGGIPRTQVVKKASEQYKQVHEDRLASGRNLMQGDRRHLQPDHTYGLESGNDRTSVGELIHGFYSEAERLPDDDLGRCTVPGRRNFVTAAPRGIPTVRLDKRAPPVERRSVSNSTNYGDDVEAFGLIFPNKFQFMGVCDDDFVARRGREEMRSLVKGAGYKLNESDFDNVFSYALKLHEGDPIQANKGDIVSLEAFMAVYADWTAAGSPPFDDSGATMEATGLQTPDVGVTLEATQQPEPQAFMAADETAQPVAAAG